jgi:hypothetical protein
MDGVIINFAKLVFSFFTLAEEMRKETYLSIIINITRF